MFSGGWRSLFRALAKNMAEWKIPCSKLTRSETSVSETFICALGHSGEKWRQCHESRMVFVDGNYRVDIYIHFIRPNQLDVYPKESNLGSGDKQLCIDRYNYLNNTSRMSSEGPSFWPFVLTLRSGSSLETSNICLYILRQSNSLNALLGKSNSRPAIQYIYRAVFPRSSI